MVDEGAKMSRRRKDENTKIIDGYNIVTENRSESVGRPISCSFLVMSQILACRPDGRIRTVQYMYFERYDVQYRYRYRISRHKKIAKSCIGRLVEEFSLTFTELVQYDVRHTTSGGI